MGRRSLCRGTQWYHHARCPFIGGNGAIGIITVSREGNRLSYRGRVGGDGVNGGSGGLIGRRGCVYVILSSASLASLSSEKST